MKYYLQWASIAVTRLRPRKARGATAPLTLESSPQWRIWVFLIVSCSSHLMISNRKTNWLSRKPHNLMSWKGFSLERRSRAAFISRPQMGHRH
ncbi:hypothetical protein Y032_0025g1210 [Ancylostoma ceylanicum]|uniref:Uncharacterized protein n=1 Tax=Ancylostoma ceylanicum TaxID=53326 RepID=A0A016UUR1_9BILA|nr:hypothetical protein Y032_0025g1210 [Ancylostoma ceylanicum]